MKFGFVFGLMNFGLALFDFFVNNEKRRRHVVLFILLYFVVSGIEHLLSRGEISGELSSYRLA